MRAVRLYALHHTVLLWAVPVVLGSLLFFLIRIAPELRMVLTQSIFPQDATCGCASLLAFSLHPFFYSFLFFFAAVGVLVLALFVARLFLLWKKTRQTLGQIDGIKSETLVHEGALYTVLTVRGAALASYTIGVFQPLIIISEQMRARLRPDEYHAVLMHEIGHIALWHVFKKYLLFAFLDAFFFVPNISALKKSLECAQELAADAYALRSTTRTTLLSAFTRTITQSRATPMVTGAISHFSFGDMRLCHLLTHDLHFPHIRICAAVMFIFLGLAVASGVLAQGLGLLHDSSASHTGRTIKMCYEEIKQEDRQQFRSPFSNYCPAALLQQQMIVEIEFLTRTPRSTILYSR